jgi:hypothetical protein
MRIFTSELKNNPIKSRLQLVEQILKTYTPKNLTPTLQLRRQKYLEVLHQYWMKGEFPRNYTHPENRVPCFIDRDGSVCAVAHLIFSAGESEMANSIASQANNAYITEMNFAGLDTWVAQSGFILQELRLIQPTYEFVKRKRREREEETLQLYQQAQKYVEEKNWEQSRLCLLDAIQVCSQDYEITAKYHENCFNLLEFVQERIEESN